MVERCSAVARVRNLLHSILHPLLQVEGLARSASPMSAAQLAALGAAASWRLGKWDLVEGYVQAADACYAKLDTDARWEVRSRPFWSGGPVRRHSRSGIAALRKATA